MKIAMVVTGGLHPSGREQVVPSWLALFARLARTHEVHAFALRHLPQPRTYELMGFTVHDLGRPEAPLGLTRRVQSRALVRALADAGPFDILHGFWGDPAGQLAVLGGRHFGIPSVATFDSGEFVSLPEIDYGSQRTARGRRAIAEACTASRVHVCTQFMAAQAAAGGIAATVIPLTTVTAASAAPLAPAPARGTRLRLLQVASLSRVKNQRLLLEALARLASRIEATLDLAGEDTLGGELQRHAADLGVADRVTFHGFVPQDALAPLYAAADVYVQSSRHEAAGVSVLEAAAAGVPIVGTRAGYVADWATEMAVAIDDANPDSLADAILAIHADPAARARADRARAWSIEHDADRMTAAFEALYLDLVRS
jgi:glycosyltransferase involved in cell wall biosynthesis